jgi:dihydrofolate synthase/folylpolyglutamate synthase
VKYAVVEAGLGGRLDATNVIPSRLTVLTSVGYDHTEWLGETLEEIAAEKVAVLRDHTALVREELPAGAEELVVREVQRRHAEDMRLEIEGPADVVSFKDHNWVLAIGAVSALLGELDSEAVNHALEELRIPGRAELVPGDPPEVFDAAHNPDGARALAEALPELAEGREVVCCLAVLEGKDATGIIEGLAAAVSHFVCTEIPPGSIEGSGRPGGRARPALELAALCEKAGVRAEAISAPVDAWARARDVARERRGVALATGSHYLLSCIWTERPAQSS